jgi:hypothetical protein
VFGFSVESLKYFLFLGKLGKMWSQMYIGLLQDNQHMKVVSCQPYTPVAFTPRKYSWYSFLLEAESTPGPQCYRKDDVNENSNDTIGNRTRDLPVCSAVPQLTAPRAACRAPVIHVMFYWILNFLDRFSKDINQISRKSFQWEPSCSRRTEGQTDITKLAAFRKFVIGPEKCILSDFTATIRQEWIWMMNLQLRI